MAKNTPIPVRFDAATAERLEKAAKRLGMPKSMVIRMLVERFVDSFEQNGGRITMPLRVVGADQEEPCLRVAEPSSPDYGEPT